MVQLSHRQGGVENSAQSDGTRRMPSDGALDDGLAFLREGYGFVSNRCDRLGSDVFRTRIMLTPVICMRGAEAAEIFYGQGRFTRVGAMPRSTLWLLQDEGSVQLLDGPAHRRRKAMFMAMMTPEGLSDITAIFADQWREALHRWSRKERVVLHRELGDVLTRSAVRWAGVPLTEDEIEPRTQQLTAMIEYAGSIGPTNWWARHLRRRCERWAENVIAAIRRGEIDAPPQSPAGIIARHTDLDNEPLPEWVAAVELLNVLRPIVAVARFITFAALALHRHPQWRERFEAGDEADLAGFVHEVRRFYPFFPVIGGRVVEPFSWLGYAFHKDDWVLLDIYGTNHDGRLWPEPEQFRPDRFRNWSGNPFTLIPQGGGDFERGHRCPGEWLTIALIQEAVRLLSRTRYRVPEQDLTVSLSTMPALPASGFVIADLNPEALHYSPPASAAVHQS